MEIKTCEQYVLDQLEQARAERDWLRGELEQAQDEAEELRGKLIERGKRDASKVAMRAAVSSTATAPATARAWTTAASLFRSLTGASSTSATQACAAA